MLECLKSLENKKNLLHKKDQVEAITAGGKRENVALICDETGKG